MSSICGIVNLDEGPVEVAQLQSMTDAAADRTPDGRNHWVRGNVGFGYGALHTTGESSLAQQPFEDQENGLCISFAGRVDNRDELRRLLESADYKPRGDSDVELVLESYECWQEGCLDRILGDFSLALWDRNRRRLFCARDLIGARPFYYYQSAGSFYFASEIRQLLANEGIPRRPNEGMIGEYLLSRMVSKSDTQFEGVMRLPPASYLMVGAGRVEQKAYWDPTSAPSIRYKSDEDYAEHLQEVFRMAVASRLRSQFPVGMQLSGGVDSSSVVAVAADLQVKGSVDCPGLNALSLVFPEWDCDESDFIQSVAAKSGIPAIRLPPESVEQDRYRDQVSRYLDYPDYPNGTMSDPVERLAQERGINVVLTGLGGDEWFQRTDLYLADLLRKGRLLSAARWVRSLPEESMFPFRQSPWFVDGVSPLVPEGVKDLLRRGRSIDSCPAWINPEFASRNNLLDRLRQPLHWRRFGDLARAGGFRAATQGFQTHAIEMEERSAAGFHIELRYPFHDRRIIEFGLGLPPDQRWRDGLHKYVLRQAMQGLLPDKVLGRRSKAEFSRVFVESLLTAGRRAFEDLSIADAGWIDGLVVLGMFDQVERRFRTEGLCRGAELWPLWSVCGADLLFRGVFNRA